MKISVVGSINMDLSVKSDRIPQKGETLTGNDIRHIPGGKGANQAVAMAKLGGQVEMFGCVGNDANGKSLIDNLKNNGIKTDNIKFIDGVATGLAIITVAEKDNTIIVVSGANENLDKAYIDSIAGELLKSDVVLLQNEIPVETVEYAIDICHKNGIKVVLNPAPARSMSRDIMEKVTYIIPNEHETKFMFGGKEKSVLLKEHPEKLIITLGSKGVTTCLKTGEILTIPARKSSVVDTTGAGDTLIGSFTFQIANGVCIKKALEFANLAAGMSTEKFGAQAGMPTYDEVAKQLK